MGRLIDADDFKKFLRALCKAGAPYSEVIQLLDRQPTAYDVDKVVAELDNAESVKLFGSLNSGNRLIPVSDAIDIVRKGGVE